MKTLKAVGKTFLAILVVLILVHTAATLFLGWRVRAAIAEMKSKGEPTSIADLNKQPIPDSQNAAVIFERIFKDEYDLRPAGGPESVLDSSEWHKQGKSNPVLWHEAGLELKKQQHVIDEIEAAESRPRCRFKVSGDDPNKVFLELSSKHGHMRRLAQLLGANARYHSIDGDMSEAVHSVYLCYRLGDCLADQPTMISFHLRNSVNAIASKVLADCLRHGDITESQAKRLYDQLSAQDSDASYAEVMQSTKASTISTFRYHIRHGISPDLMPQMGIVGLEWRLLYTYPGRPFAYSLLLRGLALRDREIESASVPYRQEDHPRRPSEDDYQSLFGSTACYAYSCDHARMYRDQTKAYISQAQIALAVAAYEDRYGSYPGDLKELRTKLGWKLPEDPFSGKDFIYRRQGAGYILYSVGLNSKDDGGSEDYIQVRGDHEQADIVWHLER